MYRCYTENKYGDSLRDAPPKAKVYEKNFYDCLFRPGAGLDICMSHFTDVVRVIYRDPETELCDYY